MKRTIEILNFANGECEAAKESKELVDNWLKTT